MPDAIDLARAFSDTSIILNHVGGVLGVGPYSGWRQEILGSWRKDIGELAKCPNVTVKLGGVGMTSFGFDVPEREAPPSSEEIAAAWRQSGLGTFNVAVRPARDGRNPQPGQSIKIPASKAVRFHAGKAVKDALNPPKSTGNKKSPRPKRSVVSK